MTLNIEAKFYEEVHALECKYNRMCAPVYEKRGQIAAGVYEPTDAECVWDSDDEDSKNDSKSDIKIEDVTEKKEEYVFCISFRHIFFWRFLVRCKDLCLYVYILILPFCNCNFFAAPRVKTSRESRNSG